jgi:hypothetical protein
MPLMLLTVGLFCVCFAMVSFFAFSFVPFSLDAVPCVVAGVFFGAISSFLFCRMQLGSLSRKGEWLMTLKFMLLDISLILVVLMARNLLIFGEIPVDALTNVIYGLLFVIPSFEIPIAVLFVRWEKLNKKTIYTDFLSIFIKENKNAAMQGEADFNVNQIGNNPLEADVEVQARFDKIRGWLPQNPKLPQGNITSKEKKGNILDLPLRELSVGTILSIVAGFFLICVGIETFAFNDVAIQELQYFVMTWPLTEMIIYFFGFWLAIAGGVLLLTFIVINRKKYGAFLRRNLAPRRLLPYGVAAGIFYLGTIVSTSGVQFSYALPIAFIVSGIIVIGGLYRFAVTPVAFVVLLVSMLFFGTAFAGLTTVTCVNYEEHFLTAADAPNVSTLNVTVWTLNSEIDVYFTDNASQLCEIAFVEVFGVVTSGMSTTVNDNSAYQNASAPQYNYTLEKDQASITASAENFIVNITVNQDVKLNLDLSSSYGQINVNAPSSANNLQKIVAFNKYGNINLDVGDTTNLRSIAAQAGSSLDATLVSNGQNQDASVLLMGGTTKLNLQATNVASQVTGYQQAEWGKMQTSVDGFTVLYQDNSTFRAQTPNYDNSNPKLDVTASASQGQQPNLNLTLTYKEK